MSMTENKGRRREKKIKEEKGVRWKRRDVKEEVREKRRGEER